MSANIPTAREIASLARSLDLADAAALIEKYASAVAATAVAEEARDNHARIMGVIGGTFHPVKESADA